jgi:hypothetical protein
VDFEILGFFGGVYGISWDFVGFNRLYWGSRRF